MKKSVKISLLVSIICATFILPTQAQSFAQATCESGDWNPFKHDTGVATMHFCSSHPDGYSKYKINLEVKSNYTYTSVQKSTLQARGAVLTWMDPNSTTSRSISIITGESDDYTAMARVICDDVFCTTCLDSGNNSYPGGPGRATLNQSSAWVTE
ncbi:hypothetical protein SAMN02745248_01374 [Hathewaya proteolytica DSM 3090]|uniref:Uncharacterized protein n=1 Tax=Hathewaya proteolytica DSM 3090 TaxID=1121331 RepID=A0A1M6NF39_9CLOT|nr:hypothetical protein [Hathewaya proteolytica]SHJ94378.1 hypothetical protein SAMN02745248_01374 [Hathewaya proteolytica DSM 3090]